MREIVVKYSGILKILFWTGCLIILLGFAYFLDILEIDFEYSLLGAPIHSFYGISYITIFIFGYYLVCLTLILLFSILDRDKQKQLSNYKNLFLSVTTIGGGIITYSALNLLGILPSITAYHDWFDYFIIGLMFFSTNFFIIVFSNENFQRLVDYDRLWVLLLGIGIFIEIISLLTYWSLLRILRFAPNTWGVFYFFGLVFLIGGGVPLFRTYTPKNRKISTLLAILAGILMISGIIVYLTPTLAINEILVPMSIFKYNNYFDFLIYGSLLLISGISLGVRIKDIQNFFRKFSPLWLIILILGSLQVFISSLMALTDSYFIDLGLGFIFHQSTTGSMLIGMMWNVFLFNGLITSLAPLIILFSLTFQEKSIQEET